MNRVEKGSQEREAGVRWSRSVKLLRDEARAWRTSATFCTGWLDTPAEVYFWRRMPPRVYEAMRDRGQEASGMMPIRQSRDERLLFCLFLALECEDEARELTAKRASTTKRSSPVRTSRKGGRNG